MADYNILLKRFNLEPLLSNIIWLDDQYTFYKFEMTKNKELVLVDIACDEVCVSQKYSRYCGKAIDSFLDTSTAKQFKNFYLRYKEYKGTVEFIYINNGNYYFVNMKIFGVYMTINSIRIYSDFNEYISNETKLDDLLYYEFSFYLQNESNKYRILRYSKSCEEIFGIKHIETEHFDMDIKFQELIKVLKEGLIREKLKNNQTIYIGLPLRIINNKIKPMILKIIPQKKACSEFYFVEGHRLTEKELKEKSMAWFVRYETLYYSNHYGLCDIEVINKKTSKLAIMNPYFQRLILMNYNSVDEFIETSNFEEVLRKKCMQYKEIVLKTEEKEHRKYYLCKFPVFNDEEICSIHVTLIEIYTESNKELLDKLTTREKQILSLAAEGLTNRYIAEHLNLSEGTVKKTLYRGYQKLSITSRLELVKIIKGN